MLLEGKSVIITGASSGIGAAIAKKFAEEGACVLVNYAHNAAGAESVVKDITEAGGNAFAFKADVSNSEETQAMVNAAVEKFGKLDILVTAAGAYDNFVPMHETSEDVWDNTVDIDMKGVFLTCKYAIPEMLENGGVIVNIASAAGIVAGGGGIAYTSAKHSLIGLTKQLVYEYGPKIRTNAICPGLIETRMVAGLMADEGFMSRVAKTPSGRVGQPEEVAELALFLASDKSKFIYGDCILIDGGWCIRN